MNLTEKQIANVNKFLGSKGLKRHFPFVHQIIKDEMLEDGTVYKFDSWGFCRELSEEQQAEVVRIEKDQAKYNTKVLFVIESCMVDSYGEKFNMINYVTWNDEDVKLGLDLDTKGNLRCMALVENKNFYDEKELGYILIKEVVGTVRRIG